MKLNRSGFTIVEVLLVVVVITILTTIGVVSYRQSQNRAEATRVKATADIVITGLERYYKDNGEYPTPRQLAGTGTGAAILGATVTESNFSTAATLLRTSPASLYDGKVRLAPCVGASDTTACGSQSSTEINRIYYYARRTQDIESLEGHNLSPATCGIRLEATPAGNLTLRGASAYVITYYDKAAQKWIFKKSQNGTVTLTNVSPICVFTP